IVFSLTFPGSLFLRDRFRRMARKTFFNWILIALILLFFGEASGYIDFFHKAVLYTWLGVTPLALVAMNALARWAVPFILAREGNSHTAVIAGCNETGVRLAHNFAANQFIGVRCVGYFDDRSRERLHGIGNTPLLGNLSQLAEYVGQHHVDHIYL
ncbi:MAG: undecaprenyl-phosphate glucose phosphotransferase, partial [Rhodocyclaceae bacterium]|nr:undecaprenyl-phosphate glucose phosphotransferase [Rhodocyclaceae bacterium]